MCSSLWEQRHCYCRLSVLPHLANSTLILSTGSEAQLGTLVGRCARLCIWHLDVCCHGDPQNIPHTAQCDIFNKVWGLWLYCLVRLWRCEVKMWTFFVCRRGLAVCCSPEKILQLVSAVLLCIAQPKCNMKAKGILTIVTMNSVCVNVTTCVCDTVSLCVCVHAQMCIFTTVWLTSHIRDYAAENWDNTVSKRKPALIELKEQQAQHTHTHAYTLTLTHTITLCNSHWKSPFVHLNELKPGVSETWNTNLKCDYDSVSFSKETFNQKHTLDLLLVKLATHLKNIWELADKIESGEICWRNHCACMLTAHGRGSLKCEQKCNTQSSPADANIDSPMRLK